MGDTEMIVGVFLVEVELHDRGLTAATAQRDDARIVPGRESGTRMTARDKLQSDLVGLDEALGYVVVKNGV